MLTINTPMHPDRKEDMLDLLLEFFHKLQEVEIIHPCTACISFDQASRVCTKWNAAPPAHVVDREGCPEWHHNRRMPY